jgi:hypothetical protein
MSSVASSLGWNERLSKLAEPTETSRPSTDHDLAVARGRLVFRDDGAGREQQPPLRARGAAHGLGVDVLAGPLDAALQ